MRNGYRAPLYRVREDEEHVRYVRDERRFPKQHFDRVECALEMLRMLAPRGLTVAVRESQTELRCEVVTDWAQGAGSGARQAILAIPGWATREEIALAVAELAGVTDQALVFALLRRGPWRD